MSTITHFHPMFLNNVISAFSLLRKRLKKVSAFSRETNMTLESYNNYHFIPTLHSTDLGYLSFRSHCSETFISGLIARNPYDIVPCGKWKKFKNFDLLWKVLREKFGEMSKKGQVWYHFWTWILR